MIPQEQEHTIPEFSNLTNRTRRGKLKIYIGMSAGVGKTYRMLQEAHALQRNGVNVKVALVETHKRKETEASLEGLDVIPRRDVFYKGKKLDELDVQSILLLEPQVVIVDERAHTNIPGSKNEKRWQDVMDIINAGIDVITAVNIQHIESINDEVKKITGVDVQERVPDKMLQVADEVVNIDLTADELITRLKEGKIYDKSKVQQALQNFFQPEKILQLRELALKEVAGQVERKVDYEVVRDKSIRHEKFLACISSNHTTAQTIIRKTARLASYYNSDWYVLYVQRPRESADKISLASQRHLINNFKLATEAGAEEVIRVKDTKIADAIVQTAIEKKITTICIGKPHLNLFQIMLRTNAFNHLLKALSESDIDLVILS